MCAKVWTAKKLSTDSKQRSALNLPGCDDVKDDALSVIYMRHPESFKST